MALRTCLMADRSRRLQRRVRCPMAPCRACPHVRLAVRQRRDAYSHHGRGGDVLHLSWRTSMADFVAKNTTGSFDVPCMLHRRLVAHTVRHIEDSRYANLGTM